MTNGTKCPLCLNAEGGSCRQISGLDDRDISWFGCGICGMYQLTREAYLYTSKNPLTPYQRSILSHKVWTISSNSGNNPPTITNEKLTSWLSDETLPSPAMQADNLIRFIGDEVLKSGESIAMIPQNLHAIVGARSFRSVMDLVEELEGRRIIRFKHPHEITIGNNLSIPISGIKEINLTLTGWERYEQEKRGELEGSYGFIAMQFGDPGLDDFVQDVVKPAVKNGIGYDLVDMRNVTQAGVIDNIMRIRIRDSAFVIADLTHDNHGAYWEAGYAEGLGKPVIYICERTKFDNEGTHFDTNHCTTVLWSKDDPEGFDKELVATLRRSLDRSP